MSRIYKYTAMQAYHGLQRPGGNGGLGSLGPKPPPWSKGGRTPAGSAYAAAVVADNPLWYFRMGEADSHPLPSTAVNEIAGYTGTWKEEIPDTLVMAQTGILPGDSGLCVLTDTARWSGLQVDDAAGLTPAGSFSLEGWIKMTGTPASRLVIVQKENAAITYPEYSFRLDASRNLSLRLGSQNSSTNASLTTYGTALSLNTLYHLVAVFDTSDNIPRIYVNGVDVAQGSVWNFTCWNSTAHVTTLFGQSAPTYKCVNNAQEVAYYDHALTATQVLNHYTLGI